MSGWRWKDVFHQTFTFIHVGWSWQDHVPEVKVLTTLGMFAVPVTAETTLGEIRQKVQERFMAWTCG